MRVYVFIDISKKLTPSLNVLLRCIFSASLTLRFSSGCKSCLHSICYIQGTRLWFITCGWFALWVIDSVPGFSTDSQYHNVVTTLTLVDTLRDTATSTPDASHQRTKILENATLDSSASGFQTNAVMLEPTRHSNRVDHHGALIHVGSEECGAAGGFVCKTLPVYSSST